MVLWVLKRGRRWVIDMEDIGFWIQLFVYGISFGGFSGVVLTRLTHLEKKMDKHNNVLERLAIAENSLKSVHHRLDDNFRKKEV